jgi:hypothetical protein
LRYVFCDYALDTRQSNPHGGSAVAKPSQVTLVSALLQDQGSAHAPALEPLTGLSEAELSAFETMR